ncbi:MAG: hypothetical protein CMN76_17940 [Spirochaetaceae bacterium]|nr:hypothetical protein [Spirochaetaceae bacterium]|tara:strand:- start:148118 stop:149095 length:978 start_codon:yes stop_codon:yes gene_type:complete
MESSDRLRSRFDSTITPPSVDVEAQASGPSHSSIRRAAKSVEDRDKGASPEAKNSRDFERADPFELPLLSSTPDSWARAALEEPGLLLNDHAHLEKKAASNALELLCRWPHGEPPGHWVRALTSMAAEESEHLRIVTDLMMKYGISLSRNHKNPYAGALHAKVRKGNGKAELADRLYVAALIELRSCERFILLQGQAAKMALLSSASNADGRSCDAQWLNGDAGNTARGEMNESSGEERWSDKRFPDVYSAIATLYGSFLESEVGHYRAFLRLAGDFVDSADPSGPAARAENGESRSWSHWLEAEAEVMEKLDFYPGILSGHRAV